MAVQNIVKYLKGNNGLQKSIQDIYEDLGKRLEHYIDFTEHQMRILAAEGAIETHDNLTSKGITILPRLVGNYRQDLKDTAQSCFSKVINRTNVAKIFSKHGFTIVGPTQKYTAGTKVAIIEKLPNGIRVHLPEVKSRMEGSGGRATVSKNIPSLFDVGVGPTNDLGRELVEKTFKKYFKLKTKSLGGSRHQVETSSGDTMAQSTLRSNIKGKRFVKAHGGDTPHPLHVTDPDLDPLQKNVEASTAHLVNTIENLKNAQFDTTGTTLDNLDKAK